MDVLVVCVLVFTVFFILFLLYIFILFMLLFNSVSYVFYYFYVYIFLSLCMLFSLHSAFIVPTGSLRLPWLTFLQAFSSVARQMPWYNSQRRGMARTRSKLIMFFYVLFVCKCVLYYCHRVSTLLWLTNISKNLQPVALMFFPPHTQSILSIFSLIPRN